MKQYIYEFDEMQLVNTSNKNKYELQQKKMQAHNNE